MNPRWTLRLLSAVGFMLVLMDAIPYAQAVRIDGAPCVSPPPLHCPDADCPKPLLADHGNAVLPKSNRAFFLDYPCDLKPDEAVLLILSLHGAGMFGNWHRHYLPFVDLKDRYRLVIATPTAVNAQWSPENDDRHLQQIVEFVYQQIGPRNIKAFWFAGHSQGSRVAYRLLQTPFYRDRISGWLSLSGGRLGSPRAYMPRNSETLYLLPSSPDAPAETGPSLQSEELGVGLSDTTVLPDYPFSHIYSSGEHELTAAGLPGHSRWAERLGCQAQARRADVIDAKAGYVSNLRLHYGPIAGRRPRPGRARVYTYPDCRGGRIVADVIRADKRHNEGYEPNVAEEIVKMMLSSS
jgi:pimeloyl-ACP methyl ester carboxylesterase